MEYGRNDDTAALSQQRLRECDDEIQRYPPVSFGNGTHPRHDRHLFDLKGHHTLAVGECIDRRQIKRIAVALELHDLRATVLLPLLPFGTCELSQPCCRLSPFEPPGYGTSEQQPDGASENDSRRNEFAHFHC